MTLGLLLPLLVYAFVLVLHLVIPARWVDGYVTDPATGRPLRYRLNGLRVFVVTIALYALGAERGLIPWDLFWVHRWAMAAGACALGLLFTLAIVLPARPRGGLGSDLYLGRLDNPQWGGGRIDAKMFLYLVGAVMLELNVLSFAAHHALRHPDDVSPGVLLYVVMFTFFLAEYLNFEEVHLYTYDFFAERVGFKLGWGCLVFYPFFYCVGLWAVAERPNPHTPKPLLALALVLFFGGWLLARGANLQKYFFKTAPERSFLGILQPVTVAGGGKQLLCSGFWRLSRHINYLGEISMAVGLTLALGWPLSPAPWLYPLYYLVLLVPRQHFDDQRCAAKYGALWQEYCRRVPYRIVPWIY
ncbi:MAG: ergosterol biosynthesis protein [Myxococcales bacterium]|nr:ergosterol biosynthesis protein [Myxococcales bacterium]